MYLATKNGSSCRIPESKAAYYESMGYNLENLDVKGGKSSLKEKKPSKKEGNAQEDVQVNN